MKYLLTTYARGAYRTLPVAAFLGLAVAANIVTAHYGPVAVGFGLTATAGTWFAGLILLVRDWVHETTGVRWVWACIAAGAVASWWMTDLPRLAIASGIAFLISELADLFVYTPLRKQGWAKASAASNLVGSVVDSVVFLLIAGFFTWPILAGQFVAKNLITLAAIGAKEAVRRG